MCILYEIGIWVSALVLKDVAKRKGGEEAAEKTAEAGGPNA
jgi:Sec-independent protein secretion pathway component TatC